MVRCRRQNQRDVPPLEGVEQALFVVFRDFQLQGYLACGFYERLAHSVRQRRIMALRNSPFELLTRCSYQREPEVGRRTATADDHGPQVPIEDWEGAGLTEGGSQEPGEEREQGKSSQGGELTGVSDFEWCVLDFLSSAAFLSGFFPAEDLGTERERDGCETSRTALPRKLSSTLFYCTLRALRKVEQWGGYKRGGFSCRIDSYSLIASAPDAEMCCLTFVRWYG